MNTRYESKIFCRCWMLRETPLHLYGYLEFSIIRGNCSTCQQSQNMLKKRYKNIAIIPINFNCNHRVAWLVGILHMQLLMSQYIYMIGMLTLLHGVRINI